MTFPVRTIAPASEDDLRPQRIRRSAWKRAGGGLVLLNGDRDDVALLCARLAVLFGDELGDDTGAYRHWVQDEWHRYGWVEDDMLLGVLAIYDGESRRWLQWAYLLPSARRQGRFTSAWRWLVGRYPGLGIRHPLSEPIKKAFRSLPCEVWPTNLSEEDVA